ADGGHEQHARTHLDDDLLHLAAVQQMSCAVGEAGQPRDDGGELLDTVAFPAGGARQQETVGTDRDRFADPHDVTYEVRQQPVEVPGATTQLTHLDDLHRCDP